VRVARPDGGAVVFQQQADGSYKQDADVNDRLVAVKDAGGVITGYRFTVADGPEGLGVVETYDAAGHIQSLKTQGGWVLTFGWSTAATAVDIAPGEGYLISVTDTAGRQLQFKYNDGGQMRQVLDPAAGTYDYAYDDYDNLISVTNPKLEVRAYHYNEADHIQKEDGTYGLAGESAHLTHALTGITDEATKRYADYRYQFDGRGIETAHAGGAEKHTLSYNADGSTTVVDPLSQSRVYKFAVAQGVAQPQDQDQPCSTGSPYKSTQVDANGNPQYQIDFNGNRTGFVYDTVRNLETSRKEGLKADGTVTAETRTITTEWHPSLRQPAKIAQPLKLTSFEYYPSGLLKTRTERATTDKDGSKGVSATLDATVPARVWGYTYNTEGQVLTVDGPRVDVMDITTLTYYPSTDTALPPKWRKGDVQTIKNAAGHITTFNEYDALGNVLKSTDANSVVTQNAYDELGRLKTQTVGGLSSSYTYDKRGMLQSVSTPQGQQLTYAYDDAHRLKTITDRDGNRVEYTELDAMGNRKDERVYDTANKLVRQHKRNYNALNRLEQDIGATNPAKQITKYEYYLGGQVQKVTDPLARVTEHTYDALNRLKDSTLPVPEASVARPVVKYGWDGQDRLSNVTDPRLIQTSYTIDGLGNRTAVSSADAGAQSYTPDEAGNIKTAKDAKLQTTGYTYDELNRVKTVSFHDSSKQVYEYDTAANGKGKLAKITEKDTAGTVVSTLDVGYDSLGRVNKQTRALAGQSLVTQYGYDASGRLETVTYPSTRKVTYSYDASGRVSGVKTTPPGGAEVAVISSVSYYPFGGVKQYTYGNGQVQVLDQDLDGRAKGYALGAAGSYVVDYDDASQIKTIRHATDLAQTTSYGWDGLSRLSSATLPAASYGYTYDGVGNRTKATVGASSTAYSYEPAKNWLTGVGAKTQGFDANGALQTSAVGTFTHDVRGRLSKLVGTGGTTTYGVDALGLRVRKSNAQGDVLYAYDADGNLLAETTASGTIVKEYIYLGSRPVAVVAQ
jgi:YD repeat-containing protein